MSAGLYVLIAGTFGSGKSTLVRNLLNRHGGYQATGLVTRSSDGFFEAAGCYKEGKKYGGADDFGKLSDIKPLVEASNAPVFLCEGVRAATFGPISLCNFFAAKNGVFVYLFCDKELSAERIMSRSNKEMKSYKDFNSVLEGFRSIGIPCYRVSAAQSQDAVCDCMEHIIQENLR
ncbi:MAG: AAA family ATPase [Victivallales bacterium]|nr:AAA family ATPase [Victivallales bacterium]